MPSHAVPGVDPLPRTRWFGTLKVRLMAASALVIAVSVMVSVLVVLQRVEQRGEQAVMELERDHVERMASLLVQRVVGLQKMMRAVAAVMPEAASHDADAAAEFLAGKPALGVQFALMFLAGAEDRKSVV